MSVRVACVGSRLCVLFVSISLLGASGCGGGGSGGFGSSGLVQLQTTSVPTATTGVFYSTTFAASFPHSPGSFLVTGGSLPTGLTLDNETGLLSGYPRQVGTFRFEIAARDGVDPSLPFNRDANFAEDRRDFTFVVARGLPNILPQQPPSAEYRASYGYQIDVAGGTAPYTFVLAGGSLPSGVSISSSGFLGSFPTSETPDGSPYQFSVRVTDATGLQDTESLTLDVVVLPLLILTPSPLPQGAKDFAYDVTLQLASGGAGQPITWAQENDEWGPDGIPSSGDEPAVPSLVLHPGEIDLTTKGLQVTSTGHVKGTPTEAGTFLFTVQVTDEANQRAERQYELKINLGPVLTSISPNIATAAGPFFASGFNFQENAKLIFKPGLTQTEITPSRIDEFTLRFDSPPPSPGGGSVAVQVLNPDGGFFTLPNAFKFPATNLSFGTKGFIGSSVSTTGLDCADVNGDGRADVVHCGASGFQNHIAAGGVTSTSPGLLLHLNTGGSPPTFSSSSLDGGNFYGVQFVDLNSDGKLDILALGQTSVKTWLNGVPIGNFVPGPVSGLPAGFTYPQSMATGFLTSDALRDLVFCVSQTTMQSGAVYSMRGDGAGNFFLLSAATTSIPATFGVVSVTCVDVNGDGRQDVVAGRGNDVNGLGNLIGFLSLTNPDGTFGSWSSFGNPLGKTYGNTTCVLAADFTATGTPAVLSLHSIDPSDAAFQGGTQGIVSMFTGGALSQVNFPQLTTMVKQAVAFDGDFDTKPEWAVSTHVSKVSVYRGSTQVATVALDVITGTPTVTSARTGRLASGDLDGDGKNDLLVSTSYWAHDIQPYYFGATYAMNLAGNGSPLGVVFYLNTSN